MTTRIFVLTGRWGDIFNFLPLVRDYYTRTGNKPMLMVARAYSDIFEGIAYATPLIYEGDFKEVDKALFQAAQISTDIVLGQIYGNGIRSREIATSFVRESWIQAGATVPWGSLPLVFDRRDAKRERLLYEAHVPRHAQGKKLILAALDGYSSPFANKVEVLRTLQVGLHEKEYFLLNLATVSAPFIFDLLGLMDRASCIVSVDTGILHLAHAAAPPVISLITSRPSQWHGSAWRPQHQVRFFYDEFPAAKNELLYAVQLAAYQSAPTPEIIHTYAHFDTGHTDPETKRRQNFARGTWNREYETGYWASAPLWQSDATREGRDIGDECTVPYLRDVIQRGIDNAGSSHDVIAVTNADVSFLPGITGSILTACRRYGAAFTHRWDFDLLTEPLINEAQLKCGKWYPGSDAFFFTVDWFEKHGPDLPDLLMGREKNDEVFRQMIKRWGGVEIPACIYHEKHASYWERPENFETNAGNRYNRKLAEAWFKKTNYTPDDWKWWPALEGGWRFSVDTAPV